MKAWNKIVAALAASTLSLALAGCGSDGASGGGNSITVSYSEEVADELPLWIADEAGYFEKQGLKVKLVSLPSDQGFPALISGQTQLASIGGSQILSGAAAGAEVKVVGTLTPVFPYELWTKETDGKALAGKKIGITSKSGSLYIATLAALDQLGLKPSDVDLVPLGSVTNVNNALVAGTIDGAVSHPPATAKFESEGFRSVLNLTEQKLPNINVGFSVTSDYLKDNSKVVVKFLTAIKQAMAREKGDREYSTQVLKEHLGVDDQKALDETWKFYSQEVLPDVPTPTAAQLKTSQATLKGSVPGIDKVDPSAIIEPKYVEQVFGK